MPTWEGGRFSARIRVDQLDAGASCWLDVKTPGMPLPISTPLTVGDNDISPTAVRPGDAISLLRLRCTGPLSAVAIVDWLSIADGTYGFAPVADVAATVSGMKLPYGGRMSFVRGTAYQDYLFTGSDVGGFAWSEDGEDWTVANGDLDDFLDGADYGVWDAIGWTSALETRVLALTGDKDSADHGGLWLTRDFGEHWEELLPEEALGASKHFDQCTSDAYGPDLEYGMKPISSGKLLIDDPDDGTDNLYVLSQSPAATGVYWVKDALAIPSLCEPYAGSVLPTDALPRAAEIVATSSSTSFLVLGYGPRTGSDAGTSTGLYVCELVDPGVACVDGDYACVEIDEGGSGDPIPEVEVRDVEIVPGAYGQVLVADGGIRGLSDGTCELEHSTVLGIDISGTSLATLSFEVWDTDSQEEYVSGVTDRPSWAGSGGYQALDMCVQAPNGWDGYPNELVGDLVPPEAGTGGTIVSVTVDPDSQWVFTYYNAGFGKRDLACARHFRASLGPAGVLAVDDELAWSPLLDVADRDDTYKGTGAAERRSNVDPDGSYLGSEPLLEVFAGSLMHDAIFYDTGNDVRLLLAGEWHWWVPSTAAATTSGWDASANLDSIEFTMGWSEVETFQDTTMSDIAVAPSQPEDSSGYKRDIAYAAVGDIGLAFLYGHGTPADRETAQRPCTVNKLGSTARTVDVWDTPTGGDYEVWYGFVNQNSAHDKANTRMILRRDAGGWCWDGVGVSGRASFINDSLGPWQLLCQDSAEVHPTPETWPACDTVAIDEAQVMEMDSVGVPQDIVAVAPGVALLVASGACTAGNKELCASGSGEGLWVVRDTGATGLSYTKVDYDDPGDCSEVDFFEGTLSSGALTRPQSSISMHPDTAGTSTGAVRAFISSRTCGVREVNFTLGSETVDASVTWADHSVGSCGYTFPWFPGSGSSWLYDVVTLGVTASPDGKYILVYGGSGDGSTTYGGICEVNLSTGTSRTVVSAASLPMAIGSVVPHPHISGLYAVGGLRNGGCSTCADGGIYMVEAIDPFGIPGIGRRWRQRQLVANELDHHQIRGLDWGMGRALSISHLLSYNHVYAATSGGGPYDMAIEW